MKASLSVGIMMVLGLAGTTIQSVSARGILTVDELRELPDSLEQLDRYLDHPDKYWLVQDYDGIMKTCRELVKYEIHSWIVVELNRAIELLEYIHSVAPNCKPDDMSIIEDVNRITYNSGLKVLGKFMSEAKALNDKNCRTNYEFYLKRPSSTSNKSPKYGHKFRW